MANPEYEEAVRAVAKFDTVYMDTALNPSTSVVLTAIKAFGSERIMFGSDEPLNLIRSVVYRHPEKGERLAANFPYHWLDKTEHAEYGHLAKNAVHAHWQSLVAIKEAVEHFDPREQTKLKERLFKNNAKNIYTF